MHIKKNYLPILILFVLKQSNTDMNSDYDPSLYTDDGRYQNDECHKTETDNFYQLNNAQENQIDTSLRRLYALEKYLLDDPVGDQNVNCHSEVTESSAEDSENDENLGNLENIEDLENSEHFEDLENLKKGENSKNSRKGHDDSYQELFYDRYFNKFFNPESGEYHQN